MRQIKFRAWDKNNKRWMTEPEVASYSFFNDVAQYVGVAWCEFTGLLDKNGKEIFEGDVVSDEDGATYTVEFAIGAFFIRSHEDNEYNTGIWNFGSPSCLQVLGNVYEHDYLLKQ